MADQGSRKRPREGGLVSRKRPKVDSAAVRRSKGVSSTSTAVKRIKKRSLSLPLLPRHCDASLKVQVDQQLDYQTKESPCQPTMTSRLPQFSRMRDDLLFRPAEDAVELNRSEAELGKADLFHSLATLEKEAEEASAALTFSNLWRAEESGLGDEETLGTQVSELQGTGREANEPDTKEPAIDRMDELIFRESIRFILRHLLAVNLKTPISEWPRRSPSGEFRLNLKSRVEDVLDQGSKACFVERYLEVYRAGWSPVVTNVLPELATPLSIEQALFKHVLNLRHSLAYPATPDKLSIKRRRERKKEKLRKRQKNLSFLAKDEVMSDLLSKLGIDGTTDEESDHDEGGKPLIRRQPLWRSSELSSFLKELDLEDISSSIHPCRVNLEKNESAVVVLGLPINCYCSRWLSQFPNRCLVEAKATLPIIFPDVAPGYNS